MNLKNKRIGYAMTGSFCNFKSSILELKKLVDSEAKIVPIMSSNAYNRPEEFNRYTYNCSMYSETLLEN